MSNQSLKRNRYTEKEVAAILRRAVELQTARSSEAAGQDAAAGVTLAQLQQAAAELGLDSAMVQEAAAELAAGAQEQNRPSLLGGPWKLDLERIVEGKITEDQWPIILEEIRSASGRVGTPTNVGSAFEWSSTSPDTLHVSVTPHEDNTRVRVIAKHGDWGAAIYSPTVIAGAIASAALAGSLHLDAGTGWAVAAGLVSASFLAARAAFSRLCAHKNRKARELLDGVAAAIESADETKQTEDRPVTGYGEQRKQEGTEVKVQT